MKKTKLSKWSIQITPELKPDLIRHCKINGLKLSSFTEMSLRTALSASVKLN